MTTTTDTLTTAERAALVAVAEHYAPTREDVARVLAPQSIGAFYRALAKLRP